MHGESATVVWVVRLRSFVCGCGVVVVLMVKVAVSVAVVVV